MYKPRFSKRIFPLEKYIIQGILKPQKTTKKPQLKSCKTLRLQNPEIKICSACDFHDKHFGYCLIKRLGSNCPYTHGSTGYMTFKQLQH